MPRPDAARWGDTERRASVRSACASAPILHPPAMSARHAARPRPWNIPRTPLSRRAPKPGAKNGQKGPKAAKNGHRVTLSHSWRAALGPAGSVLGRMAGFGRNLKLPKTLPKPAPSCHPPTPTVLHPSARRLDCRPGQRGNSVENEIEVTFGDFGSLWFALVTSGRRIEGAISSAFGREPTPPATSGGVWVRPVRCVPESGQPEAMWEKSPRSPKT